MSLRHVQAGNYITPAWTFGQELELSMARFNYMFTYNNYTEEGEEKVKKWLTDNCKYAVFGHEVAPTTGTPHLQGYLSLQKKKTIKSLQKIFKKLDIGLAIKNADGSATSNRKYCSKDGNFWECGEINITGHTTVSQDQAFQEALLAPTYDAAINIIKTKRPRDYILHSDQIERSLRKCIKSPYVHTYELGMFKAAPIEWNNKAILLWGATNTGKTQFALANFKNPLLVRHLDKLSELTSDHDGIVFDDIDLKNRPPNSVIHLLDWDLESSIHIRYKVATIPRQMKKIFTSNLENPFYIVAETDTEIANAIERRIEKHEINLPLF